MQHLAALERLCEARRSLVRAWKEFDAAVADCVASSCVWDDVAYASGVPRRTLVRWYGGAGAAARRTFYRRRVFEQDAA